MAIRARVKTEVLKFQRLTRSRVPRVVSPFIPISVVPTRGPADSQSLNLYPT